MAKGPEETRLDSWLDGSHEGVVDLGGEAWSKAAALLVHVQLGIERAAAQAAVLGGETGPAAARAFARSAEAMGKKADELRAGGHALSKTADAVAIARQQRREMGPPPSEPVAPEPPAPGAPPTDKDLEKQAAYRSSVAAYQHDQQQREARSKAITSDMDVQYRSATDTMKKIHGEPDPVHKTSTTDGSGDGSGTTAGSGGSSRPSGTTRSPYDGGSPSPTGTSGHSPGLVTGGPGHAPASSTSAPPATHGTTTGLPGGNAQSTWTESAPGAGVPGALSTGTSGTTAPASSVGAGAGITGGAGLMGGLAAGGLGGNLTGGVRGAITPVSSSSAAGVRPIGSAARSGVSGTLGRSTTTVGTGSTGGPGRSAGGSGRSGGRPGSSSRGSAGGRGASMGATGRGGDRSRDRSQKSERDHFDEEWELEDEDIAPPVLD